MKSIGTRYQVGMRWDVVKLETLLEKLLKVESVGGGLFQSFAKDKYVN